MRSLIRPGHLEQVLLTIKQVMTVKSLQSFCEIGTSASMATWGYEASPRPCQNSLLHRTENETTV